ncbi:MAG: hemerythrin domain-containing protein [Gammaproteobacteria bacterium]
MARSRNALEILHRDHEQVQKLFERFEKAKGEARQRELCEKIIDELRTHARIEEQVFYPRMLDATGREDLFQEATIEHATVSDLLDQLSDEDAGTPRFKAMVQVLSEYVAHHVREEEEEIFPEVEKADVDLDELGKLLEECRKEGNDGDRSGRTRKGEERAGDDKDREAKGKSERKNDEDKGREKVGGKAGKRKHDDDADQEKEDERFLREHGDELSRSTQRAKWIHSKDDKPDRDGQTLATRSGEVIRAWAEARGGRPATTPGGDVERPRVLRFDFPDYDKDLQPVSWEAWLGTFEERELVFLYQETMKAGNQSNFFRLDSPEREDG